MEEKKEQKQELKVVPPVAKPVQKKAVQKKPPTPKTTPPVAEPPVRAVVTNQDAEILAALRNQDALGRLGPVAAAIGRTEPDLRAIALGIRQMTDYDRMMIKGILHL